MVIIDNDQRIGEMLPMTIVRQETLFDIQELYGMEPTHRYETIISAIDLDKIYYEVNKKSRLGAPVELNYAVKHKGKLYALMIITFFIRYVERIPTIKDLIKRLNDDFVFKNTIQEIGEVFVCLKRAIMKLIQLHIKLTSLVTVIMKFIPLYCILFKSICFRINLMIKALKVFNLSN